MTNAELIELLREAVEYIDPLACQIDETDLLDRIKAALAERQDSAKDVVEWSWGPFGASREATVNGWEIEVFYNWVNPTHSEWTAYLRRTGESEEELMQAAIKAARSLK